MSRNNKLARIKKDIKYDLNQTITFTSFKIEDLHKKYNVKTFDNCRDKLSEEDLIEYFYLTNAMFFFKSLRNIINADPKTDIVFLQNQIKGLIDLHKPDFDPETFRKYFNRKS